MEATPISEDQCIELAVDLLMATKRSLRVQKITSGANSAIKPVDLWRRLESAMKQAASGSKSWNQFPGKLLESLNRAKPTKGWSRLVCSLGRGETVTDLGEVIADPALGLAQRENWVRFKRVVGGDELTLIVAMAQVRNEEQWISSRQWGDDLPEALKGEDDAS